MSMTAFFDIRKKLSDELDEIARKDDLNVGDLDVIHKITDTIKNIDKIEMLEDEGYSADGDWMADIRGTYGRGSSYRGRHRDSMGRYSRTDARSHMKKQLEDMMRDADDDRTREALRRCVEAMEG